MSTATGTGTGSPSRHERLRAALLGHRRPVAVVGGLLVAASVPPWGWWPSAFVGIALLATVLEDEGPRRRLLLGALFSAAWFLPSTAWMLRFTLPGQLIACALFALVFGLAVAATPSGPGRYLALPAAFVLAELVRWSWPFGGVPLATIPMGQVASPLAPTVRVFGALWLVWSTVAIGTALAALLARDRRRVAASLAPVVLVGLFTVVAPRGSSVDSFDAAVVQGGGPQGTRFSTCNARAVFDRQIEATELIGDTAVDLILWPENVVNPATDATDANCETPVLTADEPPPILADIAREHDAYLMPGWFVRVDDETNVNYTQAISPTGEVVDRYDKVQLVPFGEFVPFRGLLERVAGDALPARDTEPGTGPAVLETDLGTFAVAISWEIFFDHRTRDGVRDGGEVILNPTNGASYWLTQVQTQQVASSRLRALETDRWVLQAAPTGFSAVIDPSGDVRARIDIGDRDVIIDHVDLRDGETLAVRWGSWPMALASALTLCAAWAVPRLLTARRGA